MGLDFSHGDAHWAYSGFNRFRERLAQIIGFKLRDMQGFTDSIESGLSWDNIKDPIKDLLNHSDCDGELMVNQCQTIAPRLNEMIKDWGEDDFDKIQALRLSEGMEESIGDKETFEFC